MTLPTVVLAQTYGVSLDDVLDILAVLELSEAVAGEELGLLRDEYSEDPLPTTLSAADLDRLYADVALLYQQEKVTYECDCTTAEEG